MIYISYIKKCFFININNYNENNTLQCGQIGKESVGSGDPATCFYTWQYGLKTAYECLFGSNFCHKILIPQATIHIVLLSLLFTWSSLLLLLLLLLFPV